MEDILRKLGMETFISIFTKEKIYPGIVGKLSKYELTLLGITNSADMMKLRVECIKHGNAEIVGATTSFKKEYSIREDILEHLIEAGFSMKDMASLLSISESTIYRRMRAYGIGIRQYTDIDDDDLDTTMSQLVAKFPKCGEQMLRSLLFVRGVKAMEYELPPKISDTEQDDSQFHVERNPRDDKHFDRRRELLRSCKERLGKIGTGIEPLTIAIIGTPGCGKSSFLNTAFAAFSNDHWSEYAKYGTFAGKGNKHVTRRLKCFTKNDYYKGKDDYVMPTFLDMRGFEDTNSELNKALLNIVLCGKLKENEDLSSIIKLWQTRGEVAVKDEYFGRKYLGIMPEIVPPNNLSRPFDFLLIPNRPNYYRVNRIIVVCSANPDESVPEDLLKAVSDVTTRERDITLYGVFTKTDKYKPDSYKVSEKELKFMELLGIPKTRFARVTNYCPDIDPDLTYEDTIVPSLDVPVLRLMRQIFTEEATDVYSEMPNEPPLIFIWIFILLMIGGCIFLRI